MANALELNVLRRRRRRQKKLEIWREKFKRFLEERRERVAQKLEAAEEKRARLRLLKEELEKELRLEREIRASREKEKDEGSTKKPEKNGMFFNPNFAILGFAIAPMAVGAVAIVGGKVVLSATEKKIQTALADLITLYEMTGQTDKANALKAERRKRNKPRGEASAKIAIEKRKNARQSPPDQKEIQEFMDTTLSADDFLRVDVDRIVYSDKAEKFRNIFFKLAYNLHQEGRRDEAISLAATFREKFEPAAEAKRNAVITSEAERRAAIKSKIDKYEGNVEKVEIDMVRIANESLEQQTLEASIRRVVRPTVEHTQETTSASQPSEQKSARSFFKSIPRLNKGATTMSRAPNRQPSVQPTVFPPLSER